MDKDQKRILIIQTAFIGDVILATSLIEFFRAEFPGAKIDFVTKHTNQLILDGHPAVRRLILWDKDKNKLSNLRKTIKEIREERYDYLINTHRFGSSGLMSFLARANEKIGYDKNPFSFSYDRKVKHVIGNGLHEVDRLMNLVEHISEKKYKP
ncbi:MAG: glycosyltransferase family 9 protein, partial [Cyclobacteriaceae bacterium]